MTNDEIWFDLTDKVRELAANGYEPALALLPFFRSPVSVRMAADMLTNAKAARINDYDEIEITEAVRFAIELVIMAVSEPDEVERKNWEETIMPQILARARMRYQGKGTTQ